MLDIYAQGIDITNRGLDHKFITWDKEDKLEFLKSLLEIPNPKLKLKFPILAHSLKPFYQTLTSLFAIIFGLVDDSKWMNLFS